MIALHEKVLVNFISAIKVSIISIYKIKPSHTGPTVMKIYSTDENKYIFSDSYNISFHRFIYYV